MTNRFVRPSCVMERAQSPTSFSFPRAAVFDLDGPPPAPRVDNFFPLCPVRDAVPAHSEMRRVEAFFLPFVISAIDAMVFARGPQKGTFAPLAVKIREHNFSSSRLTLVTAR